MTTLEDLVRTYKEITLHIAQLEEKKKNLSSLIMSHMSSKTVEVADYVVRCCERVNVSTPLEEARRFGATHMEETVDKEELKKLYADGAAIPGISLSKFIQIALKKSAKS